MVDGDAPKYGPAATVRDQWIGPYRVRGTSAIPLPRATNHTDPRGSEPYMSGSDTTIPTAGSRGDRCLRRVGDWAIPRQCGVDHTDHCIARGASARYGWIAARLVLTKP